MSQRFGVLVLFVVLASSCQTTSPSRRPAENLDPFFVSCRNAPLRLVLGNLRLRVKDPNVWLSNSRVYASLQCSHPPCIARASSQEEVDRLRGGLDLKSQAFKSEAVEIVSPSFSLPSDQWLFLKDLQTENYRGDRETISSSVDEKGLGFRLRIADRDFTLSEFTHATGTLFDFDVVDRNCPLTPEEAVGCESEQAPYDPSEEELSAEIDQYFRSKDYRGEDLRERLAKKQVAYGFSYIVESVRGDGSTVSSSQKNHFTKSSYRILKALTRPTCPGWKISRLALNAHNGNEPYTHYPVLDRNGYWVEDTTRRLDIAAIAARKKDLYDLYAPGTHMIFNLCFSLNLGTGKDTAIGNIFALLDPNRNPIASIRGQSGYCTNMTKRADSDPVPLWISKLLDADKTEGLTTWRNPRFN